MSGIKDIDEDELIQVEPDVLQETKAIVETCPQCGRMFGVGGARRSPSMKGVCVDCARQQRSVTKLKKEANLGWMELAREQGIPLWEQQPDESVDEYDLWCTYRDLWPDVRPTVSKVASVLRCNVNQVQRAFTKWTWASRLQAWISEVNADRVSQLRAARRTMVDEHIALGESLRHKMTEAVKYLDPEDLTPNEFVALLKETQRFEATSRDALDSLEAATARDIDGMPDGLFVSRGSVDGSNGVGSQQGNAAGLSQSDAAEVVDILRAAGVLQVNGARVGIRQTTTTEVVAE